MRRRFRLVACIVLSLATGCAEEASSSEATLPYDLANPVRSYTLPPELNEISALTDVDQNTIAALQDEAAVLYHYDLGEGRVVRRVSFGKSGDFEGLTRVDDDYYALRSNGALHHLRMRGDGTLRGVETHRLGIVSREVESLGYDARSRRLLLAPKLLPKDKDIDRDRRDVYAFDPATGLVEVVVSLSLLQVVEEARRLGFEVPLDVSGKGRVSIGLTLRFASIAVHPESGHLYLVSSADRMLLVVDREGRLVHLEKLDRKLFPQPEGLTFLPSGELLISNEGKGSAPTLLRFTQNVMRR